MVFDPRRAVIDDPVISTPARFNPANAQLDADVDFDAGTMLRSVPGSAGKLVKDTYNAIRHPVESAKAIGNLGLGVAQKLIPGEQGSEVYADQMGQFIKDRYGSVDKFQQTVMDDPVGALADLSTILTGGGSALARVPGKAGQIGAVVSKAGAAVDPLNVATNTAKVAGKAIPKAVPRTLFDKSVKHRPSLTTAEKSRMTETALREGLAPNYKGVAKAYAIMGDLNTQIDTLVDSSQQPINPGIVFRHLDDLKREAGGFKINAKKNVAEIENFEKGFRQYLSDNGINEITPRELHDFKKNAYKEINWKMKSGGASYVDNEITKATARAAKEGVGSRIPGVDDINKRLGDLLELQPELERAAGRRENHSLIGAVEPIAVIAGTGLAGSGGAATAGALSAVRRKSAEIAVYLEKLRKQKVPDTYINNNVLPALLRDAAAEIGRYKGSVEEEKNNKVNSNAYPK